MSNDSSKEVSTERSVDTVDESKLSNARVVLPESNDNDKKSFVENDSTKQDKEVEKEEENYIEKGENLVVRQNGTQLEQKNDSEPAVKSVKKEQETGSAEEINKEKPHTYELPSHIKEQYYVEDGNFYDKAGNIKFRDKGPRVITRGVNYKTIEHMLDVAQAKGWTSIKINGSKEFKKAMYVAALERGLEIDSWKERVKEYLGKNDGIKAGIDVKEEKKSSIPATNETEKPVEKSADVEKDGNVKEKYRNIFKGLSRKHREIFSFLENECIKAAKSLDLEKSKRIMGNFYSRACQIISEKKVDDFLTKTAKQEDRTLSHAVTQERVVEKNLGPGIEI
jgi:hypothetical protein